MTNKASEIKNQNQNQILELELALKNAEDSENIILTQVLLLKLSNANELDTNFKKAYLSLKKYETLKNNLKTSESLIAPNENRLKSDFESIKQEIEEKSKGFREINFQLAE